METVIRFGTTTTSRPLTMATFVSSSSAGTARQMWCMRHVMLIFLIVVSAALVDSRTTPAHAAVVDRAAGYIGQGEVGGDNKGQFVRRVLNGEEGMSWCAAFVSTVLKEEGKQYPYMRGAKKMFQIFKAQGKVVQTPEPGDLIFFWREKKSSWKGHVGIVEAVTPTTIHTIEGNVGKYPAKVKRLSYPRKDVPKLLGYARP